jgi:hypothetical protein
MPFFIIFIFSAVVIGTGALLAPAWRTDQPRIALASALALGVVVSGALFNAMLFGWDTLMVDYLLFALVTTIFLLGTLTFGQRRAEERGLSLSDFSEGWPGPQDLLALLLVALLFILPALTLPVPLDTDAQGFGYLALTARLGGGFDTLAPFHPEIDVLYAPGFSALIAYLSHQLGQGLHQVQFAVSAVLGLMLVWLAYDFGAELRDKQLGRAMALAMLGGVGLFTAYMDSHFTTLMALTFAFAFLIYTLRYLRDGWRLDAVAAGLMLGAVIITHPDTTIILALGYAPWLATMWWGRSTPPLNPLPVNGEGTSKAAPDVSTPLSPGGTEYRAVGGRGVGGEGGIHRPTLSRWLVLAAGIPLFALVTVAPWLWNIRDLLGGEIVSPFTRDPGNWRVLIFYHGVVIVPLALVGLVVGLRQRNQAALLAGGWLLLIIDFSTTGIIPRLLPWLPILHYDYPFSIAWHGPIIPYTILGGMGLLWLWERFLQARLGGFWQRYAYIILGGMIVLVLLLGVFNREFLALSKGRIGFFGAFSSHADVAAMIWLKENSPPDARILNYPTPREADWVPVIAERDSVYFRPQPFFRGDANSPTVDQPSPEQTQLLAFWNDPADPANADLLAAAGIDYVIVPQIVTDPASLATQFRWNEPFTLEMQSAVAAAPYLELVFEADGAQVYRVVK